MKGLQAIAIGCVVSCTIAAGVVGPPRPEPQPNVPSGHGTSSSATPAVTTPRKPLDTPTPTPTPTPTATPTPTPTATPTATATPSPTPTPTLQVNPATLSFIVIGQTQTVTVVAPTTVTSLSAQSSNTSVASAPGTISGGNGFFSVPVTSTGSGSATITVFGSPGQLTNTIPVSVASGAQTPGPIAQAATSLSNGASSILLAAGGAAGLAAFYNSIHPSPGPSPTPPTLSLRVNNHDQGGDGTISVSKGDTVNLSAFLSNGQVPRIAVKPAGSCNGFTATPTDAPDIYQVNVPPSATGGQTCTMVVTSNAGTSSQTVVFKVQKVQP